MFHCRPLVFFLASALFFVASSLQGAREKEWVSGFHLQGMDDRIHALAVFDDGSGPALYAGGRFLAVDGQFIVGVAKWDGASWSPLGGTTDNSTNGWVRALTVFDDGNGPALYAGGNFTVAGGVNVNHIAKWDGTTWTALETGMNGAVLALAVFDEGTGPNLFAAGEFTRANGIGTSHVARWNGNLWSPLAPVAPAFNDPVSTLVVYDDGGGPLLYAGGAFTAVFGVGTAGVAKWDGLAWTAVGDPFYLRVEDLVVYHDGSGPNLYGAGRYDDGNGGFQNGVGKWVGTEWVPVGGPADASVSALGVYDDGTGASLYLGGYFSRIDLTGAGGGIPANRVAEWDGTSWSALGDGLDGNVDAFAVFDGGSGSELFAGGDFRSAGGSAASRIAKWDGVAWSKPVSEPLGQGMDFEISALTAFDDGGGPALYAGGDFRFAGSVTAHYVAKWDGAEWASLGTGMDDEVLALAVFDDGGGSALYAGGDFETADGAPASRIAKWDGVSWSPLDTGADARVAALAAYDDGSGLALYAGGHFDATGGVSANHIAKWDGTSWTPLGEGLDGNVLALEVHDDGSGPALFAAGQFSSAGGAPATRIAKWDGAAWTPLGEGLGGTVEALQVHDDGGGPALYAGGTFQVSGDISLRRIAKWDGESWSSLESGFNFAVLSLASYDDGAGPALYAGGHFLSAGEISTERIAKWDGASWSPIGTGMNGSVAVLEVDDTGTAPALYAGGTFTFADGVPSAYIAQSARVPKLSLPVFVLNVPPETLTIPVRFNPADAAITTTTFSIDYDESCLDPDLDDDGTLDRLVLHLPGDFTVTTVFDPGDLEGEIDVSITDLTEPFALLQAGELLTIDFQSVCAHPPGTSADAPIVFSQTPSPVFADSASDPVDGTWSDGIVRIWSGERGDCDASGVFDADDLTAIYEEIFDNDGDLWTAAPGSTFPGSPAGCDPNASERITAADVPCADALLLGGSCAASPPSAGAGVDLKVSTRLEGEMVWIRTRLTANGENVGSFAFSLDLNPWVFPFSGIDADDDGIPDHLRFPLGVPDLREVRFDSSDGNGELDFLLAALGGEALPEGVLVEVGVPMDTLPSEGMLLSDAPRPSFGTPAGADLIGRTFLPTIFADGFESGGIDAWSAGVEN